MGAGFAYDYRGKSGRFYYRRFLKDTGPAGNVAYSNIGITYKF